MRMIALLSLGIWVYLFAAHGRFWLSTPGACTPSLPARIVPMSTSWCPARDEAQTIEPVIASLAAQDYAGGFQHHPRR